LKLQKGNETPPTHNNRSRAVGLIMVKNLTYDPLFIESTVSQSPSFEPTMHGVSRDTLHSRNRRLIDDLNAEGSNFVEL
jgi:hypothetical protein